MSNATPEPEPRIRTQNELISAHELTELLHEWMVRWVVGHDDGDRYSCAAPSLTDEIMSGCTLRPSPMESRNKLRMPL
jgi:hypothetical protein